MPFSLPPTDYGLQRTAKTGKPSSSSSWIVLVLLAALKVHALLSSPVESPFSVYLPHSLEAEHLEGRVGKFILP
jgi:hypothetical protein